MTQPAAGRHAPAADSTTTAKQQIRDQVQAGRGQSTAGERALADAGRTSHTLRLLDSGPAPAWVACYCSIAPEPDTGALLAALLDRGIRVLAPVLTDGAGRGLRQPDWAELIDPDRLRPGWHGIPEPDGPRLGAQGLHRADLVIGSALAATLDGRRLGTGGGWYDRALGYRREGVPLWVLLNHVEVLPELPIEPHDLPVQAIITEQAALSVN